MQSMIAIKIEFLLVLQIENRYGQIFYHNEVVQAFNKTHVYRLFKSELEKKYHSVIILNIIKLDKTIHQEWV